MKPSTKSNKSIINNAISHCCLAGSVNATMKNKVLEVLHFFSANLKLKDTVKPDLIAFLFGLGLWWFSLVSSTNKTDRHDITEILLKVVLSTITIDFFATTSMV